MPIVLTYIALTCTEQLYRAHTYINAYIYVIPIYLSFSSKRKIAERAFLEYH